MTQKKESVFAAGIRNAVFEKNQLQQKSQPEKPYIINIRITKQEPKVVYHIKLYQGRWIPELIKRHKGIETEQGVAPGS